MNQTLGWAAVCNGSCWRQLRGLMLRLDPEDRPEFRSRCIENGYVSPWDGEWFHHFSAGGWADLEWIELRGEAMRDPEVFGKIVSIQFVGAFSGNNLRLYGYVKAGEFAGKLRLRHLQDELAIIGQRDQ